MVMFALSAVKWADLIRTSLNIADSARKLYETLNKKKPRDVDATSFTEPATLSSLSTAVQQTITRLEETESDLAEQSQLVSEIATQEEALSRSLVAVSARLTALLWLSGSALLVGSIAIVLALLR